VAQQMRMRFTCGQPSRPNVTWNSLHMNASSDWNLLPLFPVPTQCQRGGHNESERAQVGCQVVEIVCEGMCPQPAQLPWGCLSQCCHVRLAMRMQRLDHLNGD
jgi:hypothetical protein